MLRKREVKTVWEPRWSDSAWVAIGLAVDWRCAFEWSAGRSPFYSELVLGRALLIVLACAGVAFLSISMIRPARWRYAFLLFGVFSMAAYRLLSNHWIAARR
jgi:hypothetical protein